MRKLSHEVVQVHEYKKHGCITCGFQNPIRPTDVILVSEVKIFIKDIIEWLRLEHRCHCEICTADFIKERYGDVYCTKDEGGQDGKKD